MLTAILAFFRTRFGQYVLIGLAFAALIAGVYRYGHSKGRDAGRVDGAKQTFDTLGAQMKTDREQFSQLLKGYADFIDKQNAVLSQKDSEIAVRDSRIANLVQLSKQNSDSIAKLSDQGVVLDLASRLGFRPATDVAPSLYPTEIRKADEIVADYALKVQTVTELGGKIDALTGKVSAMEAKQDATARQLQSALDYADRADERIRSGYNVFFKTHPRSPILKILTLGIIRDRSLPEIKPLSLPDRPKEIAK